MTNEIRKVAIIGGPYSNTILEIPEAPGDTIEKIKHCVFQTLGIPCDAQRALVSGSIKSNGAPLRDLGGPIHIIVSDRTQTKRSLRSPQEETLIELATWLQTHAGSESLRSDFFAFYGGCIERWSARAQEGIRLKIPFDPTELLSILEACKEADPSLVEFIKLHMPKGNEPFDLMRIEANYRDRVLQSPSAENAEILRELRLNPGFQNALEDQKKQRAARIQEQLAIGHFNEQPLHEIAEWYADSRRAKRPESAIFLQYVKPDEILPLIEAARMRQKEGNPPIRFQMMVDLGHHTSLDVQVDRGRISCVILDSISEINYYLTEPVIQMIEQLDAQIYLACSTVPNLNAYDLQISCDPAEDLSKAPTLDPSAKKTAIRIFRAAGSDGVSRWYFHSSSSPSILEIEDVSLIQKLEANLPTPPDPSEILKAVLESSLPLELSSLQMQKDMSSCPAFALHYAIRAGKIENLHEMCARLAESPSPILRRVSDSLSLKNPAFTRIRPVSWHSLPPEFRKWSQSVTFQIPAKQGDIFSSMGEKVKKHTVPHFESIGQTHLERLLGWMTEDKNPSSVVEL